MAGRKRRPKINEEQRRKLSKAMKGNKNSVGNNGGRPIECDKKKCRQVKNLHFLMIPIEEICKIMEISTETYYRWKKNIPEFSKAIYDGMYGIDQRIGVALRKKATGYTRTVVKPIKIKNKLGEDEIKNHEYKEYFHPDTRAIEITLKNRTQTKNQWSNLPDPDAPPPPPDIQINNIDLSQLDDATLTKLLKAIKPADDKGGAK